MIYFFIAPFDFIMIFRFCFFFRCNLIEQNQNQTKKKQSYIFFLFIGEAGDFVAWQGRQSYVSLVCCYYYFFLLFSFFFIIYSFSFFTYLLVTKKWFIHLALKSVGNAHTPTHTHTFKHFFQNKKSIESESDNMIQYDEQTIFLFSSSQSTALYLYFGLFQYI